MPAASGGEDIATSLCSPFQLDGGEANTDPQLSPKVMGDRVSMYISQGLFTYSRLGKLSEEISHEVRRLLESSKENIREYKQIREDLNV